MSIATKARLKGDVRVCDHVGVVAGAGRPFGAPAPLRRSGAKAGRAGGSPRAGGADAGPTRGPTRHGRLGSLWAGLAASAALGAPAGASAECLFATSGTGPGAIDAGLFEEPGVVCVGCHQGGDDTAAVSFRAYTTWAGTMMANSVRDPLYLAALAVAEADMPAPAQCRDPAEPAVGLGQWCVRCHSPAAFIAGNTSPLDESKWTGLELQGVSCDVCHLAMAKKNDADVTAASLLVGNAQLTFDPSGARRGPYATTSPGHPVLQDPFTSSSELCGQCHKVSNPLVTLKDAGGADTGEPFPLDTTYDEWQDSVYSVEGAEKKGCVDCHMPRVEGEHVVGMGGETDRLRADPAMHLFTGGNRWGIDAVAHADPDYANDEKNKEAFELARGAAEAMLRSSVKLESLASPSGEVSAGAQIAFGVRVTNLSGHKFPTGYADGRRAFLQVGFVDSTGREVVLSGRYENDDLVVEGDSQLRLYEAVHGMADGSPPEGHLANYESVLADSRIPPKGFVGSTITLPVGVTWYNVEGGGYRSYDEASYSLTVPSAFTDGPGRAFVRVLYQSTTKHYIETLVHANEGKNERGHKLHEIWEATGKAAPFVVAEVSTDVTLVGGTLPPPGPSKPATGSAGCSFAFGPRGHSPRAALVAAGLVALALGALRRRTR